MRVLASTTANDGHAGPLLSFARALAAARHEVAIASPVSYATAVGRAGFTHLPFADAPPELVGPVMGRLPQVSFDEADRIVVRDVFGRIDAQAALPGLRDAVEQWRPDVVLREPAELGSLAAAVQAGLPHVQVTIGVQEMTRYFLEMTVEPLVELGELSGLPGPALGDALRREVALSLVPESFDRAGDEGYLDALVVHRFRDLDPVDSPAPLPGWGDSALPLVYVTFGSVAGSLPPFAGVFRTALDALADDDVRVLMTLGRGIDPASLGPLPANAHVVQWLPQDDVLASASAVLSHGGFGTTYGALARGVPQVVAPLFTSDQAANGRHVAAAGAGRSVPPGPEVVERAVEELRALLVDPGRVEGARACAEQVAALPPVGEASTVLEDLLG